MLGLIHNLRFDRIKNNDRYSFKKNLNNFSTEELSNLLEPQNYGGTILSNDWIKLYRKQ